MVATTQFPETYQGKLQSALKLYRSHEQRFRNLSTLIQTATSQEDGKLQLGTFQSQAQMFIDQISPVALSTLLCEGYKHYNTVIKEHQVAMEALAQFREILRLCTPGKIRLTPVVVTHLSGLGLLEAYREKEKVHLDSCEILQQTIGDLEGLIRNTDHFIKQMKQIGGLAAFGFNTLHGKTGVSDLLTSYDYYFDQGFATYTQQQANKSVKASTTNEVAGDL